jgi:hypothetical protein
MATSTFPSGPWEQVTFRLRLIQNGPVDEAEVDAGDVRTAGCTRALGKDLLKRRPDHCLVARDMRRVDGAAAALLDRVSQHRFKLSCVYDLPRPEADARDLHSKVKSQ